MWLDPEGKAAVRRDSDAKSPASNGRAQVSVLSRLGRRLGVDAVDVPPVV